MIIEKSLPKHITRLLTCKSRYKFLRWGRRSGKTEYAIYSVVGAILKKSYNGYGNYLPPKIAYITDTFKHAKTLFWKRLISSLGPIIEEANHSDLWVRFVNGAELQLYGVDRNPDGIRGTYLTHCIIDEAAFIKGLKEILDSCVKPMLADVGGSMDIMSSPRGFGDFKTIEDDWAQLDYATVSVVRSIDAGFVNKAFLEEQKRTINPRNYACEYDAEYIAGTEIAYHGYKQGYHDVKLKPAEWYEPLYMSWDFNENPSCHLIVASFIDRKHIGIHETIANGLTKDCMRLFCERYSPRMNAVIYITGDAYGAKSTSISDYRLVVSLLVKAGWSESNIHVRVPKSNPSQKDRVNKVNDWFENGLGESRILIDKEGNEALLRDLKEVLRTDIGGVNKTNPALTHASDAFGYLIMTADRLGWPE